MLFPTLIAGFTLGAAGSFHCIGMCGPLSMALPTWHLSSSRKFFSLLLYQLGRIITYSIFGLIFGLAGRSIYLAGFQQWFSIIAGSLILTTAALYFVQKHIIGFSFLNHFYVLVQILIGKILKRHSNPSGFLLLGIANGLLPCGMVYMAIAATLSFTRLSQSIGFMFMFGAGTLPTMLFIAYSKQLIRPGVRIALRKSMPAFIILVGLLLIFRGLNLGIMFVSPKLPEHTGHIINCRT